MIITNETSYFIPKKEKATSDQKWPFKINYLKLIFFLKKRLSLHLNLDHTL